MTKKQQHEILKNALLRLHFHRTVSEKPELEEQMVHALMAFAHNLGRADHIEATTESKKEVDAAFDLAYQTLQKETV